MPDTAMDFFKKLLPTSFEVTFLPLFIVYVLFALLFPVHPMLAMLFPTGYLGMCVLFILVDFMDPNRLPLRWLFARIAFCVICVSPMLLVIARTFVYDR
jgi:hypothetical protein